ncbi:HNH endonuclease [Vibrio cholerae]
MKKLQPHNITFADMLKKCSEGMDQVHVKENFVDQFQKFFLKENQYQGLSLAGNLFQYPKVMPLTDDTQVVGNLTKRKLVNLYENNLRNKDKPARRLYDELLISSGERCPFCGDIGQTKNLDHFLPKAHFPEFSIMPLNLVPSCRDCNMGEKGQNYATIEEEQAIHPYIDKDIFFRSSGYSLITLTRMRGRLTTMLGVLLRGVKKIKTEHATTLPILI